MPMYPYQCQTCNHEEDEFQHMREDHLTVCPACGSDTYDRQVSLPHTDMKEFHKPIEMYSIGLTDDEEIKAFKRQAPDVYVDMNPKSELYGVPIAKSRKQKLSALAATGCVERK